MRPRPTINPLESVGMDMDRFLEPKIHILAGKGGVGKTTVAAALALLAARRGKKVLVAEVDSKGSLPRLFGQWLPSSEPTEVTPGVWTLNILPEQALTEYLDVQYNMGRIARVLRSTHFIDYISLTAPGLKDVLALGKIWWLEQNHPGSKLPQDFDSIIVDAQGTGHMLTFLSAPSGLADAVQVGPIKRQAELLTSMLRDPSRCCAHLVTLAEEMSVEETLATANSLRHDLHISQGALFANGLYPRLLERHPEALRLIEEKGSSLLSERAADVQLSLDEEDIQVILGYAQFARARRKSQVRHLRKLSRAVPEPIVRLPFIFTPSIGLPEIDTLADSMQEQVSAL
jgi:anion-transporting  ArsA/GET3 family ATPase